MDAIVTGEGQSSSIHPLDVELLLIQWFVEHGISPMPSFILSGPKLFVPPPELLAMAVSARLTQVGQSLSVEP